MIEVDGELFGRPITTFTLDAAELARLTAGEPLLLTSTPSLTPPRLMYVTVAAGGQDDVPKAAERVRQAATRLLRRG